MTIKKKWKKNLTMNENNVEKYLSKGKQRMPFYQTCEHCFGLNVALMATLKLWNCEQKVNLNEQIFIWRGLDGWSAEKREKKCFEKKFLVIKLYLNVYDIFSTNKNKHCNITSSTCISVIWSLIYLLLKLFVFFITKWAQTLLIFFTKNHFFAKTWGCWQ